MEVIDDIGDTATDSEDEEEEELKNAQIVGVPMFDKYRSCLRCKARVEPCSSTTATCSRDDCQMLQRYDVTQYIVYTCVCAYVYSEESFQGENVRKSVLWD